MDGDAPTYKGLPVELLEKAYQIEIALQKRGLSLITAVDLFSAGFQLAREEQAIRQQEIIERAIMDVRMKPISGEER